MSATGVRHAEVRAFLSEHIEPAAAARALQRITAHDEELDESYRWASVPALVRELGEEPLDVIAWASILSVRCTSERELALLAAIAQRGAEAVALHDELCRIVDHEQRSAPDQDGATDRDVLFDAGPPLPRTAILEDTQS
ncbi:MAG: hypothetical protein WKF96_24415 [Solirubrobacteraceae bacterium]